jgi:hypothetical protein
VGESDEKDPQTGHNGGGGIDVRALMAELEETLRSSTRRGTSRGSSIWLDARARAERTWRVSVDHVSGARGGAAGAAQRPVKAAVRKLVRWYVEPVFADQRAYNAALLRIVDELHAENERLRGELERLRSEA